MDLLTSPQGADALVDTLLYHVSPQVIPSTLIPRGQTFLDTALEGTKVLVKVYPLSIFVNRAKIIDTDGLANNGIIHAIDQVLIPPSLREPVRPPPRNIYKGKGYYFPSRGYSKGYAKGCEYIDVLCSACPDDWQEKAHFCILHSFWPSLFGCLTNLFKWILSQNYVINHSHVFLIPCLTHRFFLW